MAGSHEAIPMVIQYRIKQVKCRCYGQRPPLPKSRSK